jgi:alpha-tubulin suppressor-like RCC1 family protein
MKTKPYIFVLAVFCWFPPSLLRAATIVTHASTGYSHSLFVRSDGSLWGMGDNSLGQLGVSAITSTNQPVMILASGVPNCFASDYYSFFIKTDGSLWAMGGNIYGELGNGGTNSEYLPIQITNGVAAFSAGYAHTLFITTSGSLWGCGLNAYGELGDGPAVPTRLSPEMIVPSNVVSCAAGAYDSYFVQANGSLWRMGGNVSGELGDGTTNTSYFPEQLPGNNVVSVTGGSALGSQFFFTESDQSVWGINADQIVNLNSSVGFTRAPILVIPGTPAIKSVTRSGSNLVLNAVNGGQADILYTLASTNLLLPRSQWKCIATNNLITNGNFSITVSNVVNASPGSQFFTLEFQ